MVCILHGYYDAHPKMRFSLSPPPPKTILNLKPSSKSPSKGTMDTTTNPKSSESEKSRNDDFTEDYNEWLHAMKMVTRLPGGTPPEFRRKLWLSLADKYLKSKNVDWSKEEEKCFCEKWREDDEELGIQIVKDLHRTGSNLCTGPAGSINQAKLKRVLLGYARYNPVVGYCQGFNMLGALILQVMDKDEAESIKVMIYLVEGVLPHGYFCGSMGGLQADMSVFRDLMQVKLPRLAKHLQKLQGPLENAYEPPLTNVFTMQWFLTMFCTCLPMNCVLRVWDLVLIEGSDVLLRTALVLWSLLEERVLKARSADEFYCNMGSYTSELLNGHLIDSNALIEKIVQLGPIRDIDKLRDRHRYNISPLRTEQNLSMYFDDDLESDEESRLALATVWGLSWVRRSSQSQASAKQATENKDRIALDISLLKKQYDRLRERQKQAHIILTTACSTARQGSSQLQQQQPTSQLPVGQLLMGRSAIITNKGRRTGPPIGAIPPARKPSLPTVLQSTKPPEKQLRRGETLQWQEADSKLKRRESLTWKEIKAERAALKREGAIETLKSHKIRSRTSRSDSSSYSEDDSNEENNDSSTDTSLCDDAEAGNRSSFEGSPKRKIHAKSKVKDLTRNNERQDFLEPVGEVEVRKRPKSWAPSSHEIPFMLMTSDSPQHSGDERAQVETVKDLKDDAVDSGAECDRLSGSQNSEYKWSSSTFSTVAGDLASSKLAPLHVDIEHPSFPITSTSQLSPMPDISGFLKNSIVSPLPTPKPLYLDSVNSLGSGDVDGENNGKPKDFDVGDDGVTNQYFERVNSVERPTTLDLFFSLNDETNKFQKECGVIGSFDDIPTDSIKDFKMMDETHDFSKSYPPRDDYIPGENREDEFTEPFPDYSFPLKSNFDVSEEKLQESEDFPIISRLNLLELEQHLEAVDKYLGKNKIEIEMQRRNSDHLEKSLLKDFEAQIIQSREKEENVESTLNRFKRNFQAFNAEIQHRQITQQKGGNFCQKSQMRRPVRKPTKQESFGGYNEKISLERSPKGDSFDSFFSPLSIKIDSSDRWCDNSGELHYSRNFKDMKRLLFLEENKDISPEAALKKSLLLMETVKARSLADSGEQQNKSTKTQLSASSSPTGERSQINGQKSTNKDEDNERLLNRKQSNDRNSPKQKKEDLDSTTSDPEKKPTASFAEEGEHSEPKRLPSTAELEERFRELERQESFEKSHQKKKQKEPPDESQDEEKPASRKKLETSDDHPKDVERKASTEPPSTESLEKRFQEMEKRLSSKDSEKTKSEASEKEVEAKERPKDFSKVFEDKCKKINEALSSSQSEMKEKPVQKVNEDVQNQKAEDKEGTKEQPKEEPQKNEKQLQKPADDLKDVEVKKEQMKKTEDLKKGAEKQEEKEPGAIESTASSIPSKRRASEPPTTEELEKRFESMQRRMSSRNIEEPEVLKSDSFKMKKEKTSQDSEHTGERKGRKVSQSHETVDEEVEPEPAVSSVSAKRKTPSTKDLESRFDALVNQAMSEKSKTEQKVAEQDDEQKPETKTKEKISEAKGESIKKDEAIEKVTKTSRDKTPEEIESPPKHLEEKSNISNQIPEAPPMPEVSFDNSHSNDAASLNQRRALVEELQSKIKTPPNGENLKPSLINPQRRKYLQKLKYSSDDTLEAHANHAYFRSVNNEPYYNWLQNQPYDQQQFYSSKISVRRFSDLPSRADLENRLQYLEQKLYKSFTKKQRRAGDSEVPSKLDRNKLNDLPTSSANAMETNKSKELEDRVKALEKQLSENSLKILQTMKEKTKISTSLDYDSPKQMSLESIDATGKELVRYTHHSDVDEMESNKPINISINIKMMLNKDKVAESKKPVVSSNNDEIQKRLEALERQLEETKLNILGRNPLVVSQSPIEPGIQEVTPMNQSSETSDQKPPDTKKNPQKKEAAKDPADKTSEETSSKIEDLPSKSEEKPKDSTTASKEDNKEKLKKENKVKPDENSEKSTELAAEKSSAETKQKSVTEIKKQSTETSEKPLPEKSKEKPLEKLAVKESSQDTKENLKETSKEGTQMKTSEQPKITSEEKSELRSEGASAVVKTSSAQKESTETSEITGNSQQLSEKSLEPTSENIIINAGDDLAVATDPNKKTLVLLMDNEPKAVKVRRLTRANTEELENLFQALEKQLSERNLIKSEDGRLIHADSIDQTNTEQAQALADLSKEITEFSQTSQNEDSSTKASKEKLNKEVQESEAKDSQETEQEDYDWGPNTVKHHLKRKTVYLPSTKELEARFRSLERQIHLLEHVEKIDVEQRLSEIERKIKLQYSLSHEKDLNKFLDLCEGKLEDDEPEEIDLEEDFIEESRPSRSPHQSPSRAKSKSPYTSPARERACRSKTPPATTPTRSTTKSPLPSQETKDKRKSPYTSPVRSRSKDVSKPSLKNKDDSSQIPSTEDLEYRYRSLDLKPSRSKENLSEKIKRKRQDPKKQPIHPLELLIDSSPDDSAIPTTGELEHRMRILDEKKRNTPSPTSRSRSHSPALKKEKSKEELKPKSHLVTYTDKPEPPTAEELEARMKALEEKQCFDFKTQKTFKEFNQKLKDVVSPSLSFEEFKAAKSREQSPSREKKPTTPKSPKSALKGIDAADYGRSHDSQYHRSTSPKVIRFQDEDEPSSYRDDFEEDKEKTTIADNRSRSSSRSALMTASAEGLDAFGSRLMRETSPLRRTGTHTGVPLKTDDNINDRLSSIKNTIKSIDSLCEEKPYHKEKCQRYIDSLFSDSIHFSSKKNSLEDLGRGESRISRRDYTPSIRVSDLTERPSSYRGRSIGSAESVRSSSPLRAASPLHHRSTRDIRRDVSPRSRLDEELEEIDRSRVRRDYMLPNYFHDNHNSLSSYGSLTKFHKVDRQLDTYKYDDRYDSKYEYTRSASRSPLKSPYGSKEEMLKPQHHHYNLTKADHTTKLTTTSSKPYFSERPVSPYRQSSHNLNTGYDSYKRNPTPTYAPGKLEIRHTTVTSTFYDRILTEKQLEKQYSRPPSRSPLVSPSVGTKTYMDSISNNSNNSNITTSTTSTATNMPHTDTQTPSSNVGTSVISIAITALSDSTPVYTSSTYSASSTIGLIPRTSNVTHVTTTSTASMTSSYSKGNSNNTETSISSLPQASNDPLSIDSRIQKCQNLLSQFTIRSALTTTSTTTSSTISSSNTISTNLMTTTTSYLTTSVASPSKTSMSYTSPSTFSSQMSRTLGNQNHTISVSNITTNSLPTISMASFSVTNPLTVTVSRPSFNLGISPFPQTLITTAFANPPTTYPGVTTTLSSMTTAPMPNIRTNISNTILTSSNIPTLSSSSVSNYAPVRTTTQETQRFYMSSSTNQSSSGVNLITSAAPASATTTTVTTSSVSSIISSLTSSLPKAPSFSALSSTTTTTTSSSVSSHLPFSYLNPLKSPAKTATAATTTSTGSTGTSTFSTGVVNPLMNFSLKQPFSFGKKN